MASFRIVIRESAEAELISAPFPFRRQINQRIQKLKAEPRPEGAERIGDSETFRLRSSGWVVVYEVDEEEHVVTIVRIRPALEG